MNPTKSGANMISNSKIPVEPFIEISKNIPFSVKSIRIKNQVFSSLQESIDFFDHSQVIRKSDILTTYNCQRFILVIYRKDNAFNLYISMEIDKRLSLKGNLFRNGDGQLISEEKIFCLA